MRNIILATCAWAAVGVITPGTGRAAVQTEAFSIQVPAGTAVTPATNVASSAFPQFNPANGTLNSVTTNYVGSGSWTDPVGGRVLTLALVVHDKSVVLAGQDFFFSPGAKTFGFSGTDVFLPELTSFIGSGLTQVDLQLSGGGGTFATPLTNGTISYNFTPAVVVPEPGTTWVMGIGLVAAGLLRASRGANRASRTPAAAQS